MDWLSDELLFFGGTGVAVGSLLLTLIYSLFSHMAKKRLNAKLDEEYGEKIRDQR